MSQTRATCARPGCDAPRHRRDTYHYSKFCTAHFEANKARHFAPPNAPTDYTPAQVLEAWREGRTLGDLYIDGRRVFGLQCTQGVYRAQLAGADSGVVLDGGERLARVLRGGA